ncbi:hypothetical protein [Ensifer sesbaniae]|uniref:hypothetical protein n=1 Tax=Ensifer sesbaniae TaxID=1214071 RepID=UPI001568E838|nr:hypothetical protein [Ensifer sesbaniae]NRQ19208.1 hypothetical protein [Ensifer sesbaniae]
MPFRTFPCIFCLLLCTNALAIYAVSHPVRSLLVVILAYSLLLQIAYVGSVFLLVCLIALSKGLTNFRLVIGAQIQNVRGKGKVWQIVTPPAQPAWGKVEGERLERASRASERLH